MKSFRDFIFEQIGRKRIVMLGGPGSGKSTYTEYLVKEYDITHIYPGGMLRKEVEKGSEIGKIAKSIIDRGEFVPNQIVLELIKDKVEKSPKGYVLDGWPRYMQQVEDMEKNEIGYDYAVFTAFDTGVVTAVFNDFPPEAIKYFKYKTEFPEKPEVMIRIYQLFG